MPVCPANCVEDELVCHVQTPTAGGLKCTRHAEPPSKNPFAFIVVPSSRRKVATRSISKALDDGESAGPVKVRVVRLKRGIVVIRPAAESRATASVQITEGEMIAVGASQGAVGVHVSMPSTVPVSLLTLLLTPSYKIGKNCSADETVCHDTTICEAGVCVMCLTDEECLLADRLTRARACKSRTFTEYARISTCYRRTR